MPEQLSAQVAAELRRLLDDRGLSGRQLSRQTGIPQKTIADKLADRSPFDLDDLQAICAVLDVDVTDLMTWAQKR